MPHKYNYSIFDIEINLRTVSGNFHYVLFDLLAIETVQFSELLQNSLSCEVYTYLWISNCNMYAFSVYFL